MKFFVQLALALSAILVAGCSTGVRTATSSVSLDGSASWALLPIVNNTDTPQAALSAESMLEHLLRHRGLGRLMPYPSALTRDSLFEPTERKVLEEAQKWAIGQGAQFAVTGSVEEWRYKVGLDGEPAVGVTLKVIDLRSGRVVWSASGAKSGWSREALSGVAQTLLADLLVALPLAAEPIASP